MNPLRHAAALPGISPDYDSLTPIPDPAVSDSRCERVGGNRLSDSELEAAIKQAGDAMQRHYADWLETGCFAAKGNADRAMRLMYELIRKRLPETVARLERERGLS